MFAPTTRFTSFLFFKNMKQVGKVVGANLEAIHNTIQAHL